MPKTTSDFDARLAQNGITRRKFLEFCGLMTATLAMPAGYVSRIAHALETTPRVPVVWLSFQECTGDTESLLRANDPTIVTLLLDTISLNFHEALMVAAGHQAEKSLDDTLLAYPGQYICITEGAIPTRDGGIHCIIGGRTGLSIAEEVCRNALINIAAGSCSTDGGIQAAAPNPTQARSLGDAVSGVPNLLNMPGCPVNGVNLVAAIVHYLTFNALPSYDSQRRPLFAYGQEIHDERNCDRYPFYEADLYVREWDDEGHRQGWCLKRMGCRGPDTEANCFKRNWNSNTNWPIGAGHHCIGCTSYQFWDRHTPFYGGESHDDDDHHDDEHDDD